MRLRMLKHCVVKGRHVMKPLHVCLIVLQYYARVATGRAGYVLYRALVVDAYPPPPRPYNYIMIIKIIISCYISAYHHTLQPLITRISEKQPLNSLKGVQPFCTRVEALIGACALSQIYINYYYVGGAYACIWILFINFNNNAVHT